MPPSFKKPSSFFDDQSLAPDGRFSAGEFNSRIARYEASTEPLARIAGVLGRWGDGSEFNLVIDTIQALWAKTTDVRGGRQVWIYIRSYAAVLVLTAYGLGLTRSGRWDELHRLFLARLRPQGGGEERRFVDCLFLWAWEGGDKDIWKHRTGMGDRRTPLSDHLLLLFQEWGESFIGITADFEWLFEKYEILGALAHTEENDLTSLEETLNRNDRDAYLWVPVGRGGWDQRKRDRILAEIQTSELQSLLAAGFGGGDEQFLALAIANYKRLANRFRF